MAKLWDLPGLQNVNSLFLTLYCTDDRISAAARMSALRSDVTCKNETHANIPSDKMFLQ